MTLARLAACLFSFVCFTVISAKNILLELAARLYLFKDGFADQFGGEKGKKIKYKSLHKILFDKRLSSQQQQQFASFLSWKGDYEQVNDVCVLGIPHLNQVKI